MEPSRRPSVVLATLLCCCALVVAGTALEQSLAADAYRSAEPLDRSPSGGLLLLLLAFLFRLFGLEPPTAVGAPGASAIGHLVAFLAANAAELVALAALVVLSGGVWLAVRRVDAVERPGDRVTNASADAAPRERPESLRTVEPANEVYRAWLVVVRRVASDPSRSRTPTEWAERAIDSGLDASAVRAVTDAFRKVRYGGVALTEDEKRRVRDALARLDAKRGRDR